MQPPIERRFRRRFPPRPGGPRPTMRAAVLRRYVTIATIGGMPEMAHGVIFVTIYAVVLAAAALALFQRRDIAGAKGG